MWIWQAIILSQANDSRLCVRASDGQCLRELRDPVARPCNLRASRNCINAFTIPTDFIYRTYLGLHLCLCGSFFVGLLRKHLEVSARFADIAHALRYAKRVKMFQDRNRVFS